MSEPNKSPLHWREPSRAYQTLSGQPAMRCLVIKLMGAGREVVQCHLCVHATDNEEADRALLRKMMGDHVHAAILADEWNAGR